MTLTELRNTVARGPVAPTVYHPTVGLRECPICWAVYRDTRLGCSVCGAIPVWDRTYAYSADGSRLRRLASCHGAHREGTWARLYRLAVESADPDA